MASISRGAAFTSLPFFAADSNQEGVSGVAPWQVYASQGAMPFQSIEATVAEIGMGWYTLSLDPSQTQTVGSLTVMLEGPGARPVKFQFIVKE